MVLEKKKRKYGDGSIPRSGRPRESCRSHVSSGGSDASSFPRRPTHFRLSVGTSTQRDSSSTISFDAHAISICRLVPSHLKIPTRHLFIQIKVALI